MYNTVLLNKFSQHWIFPFPKSSIKIVFSCQRHQGLRTTAFLLWTYYMVCVWLRIFLTDSPAPFWEADSAELLQHIPTLFRIRVPSLCQLPDRRGADAASLLLCILKGEKTLQCCFFVCFAVGTFQSNSPTSPQVVRTWARQSLLSTAWSGTISVLWAMLISPTPATHSIPVAFSFPVPHHCLTLWPAP